MAEISSQLRALGEDEEPEVRVPVPIRIRRKEGPMRASPSPLDTEDRKELAEALNGVLADGIDLFTQLKVAHWNVKGPNFGSLHPLFEEFADGIAEFNDTVAERAVTLGGRALGTVRHCAAVSRLPEYPQDTVKDLEHVRLLKERIQKYLEGVGAARKQAEDEKDMDTFDDLTAIVKKFEKYSWFLRATLGE